MLVGGRGSIKTTLYDLCLRSTTVVQGFPAVHSFCTESPETRRGFLLSGAGSLGWVGAGFLRPQWVTTPPSPLRKVPDHTDTLVCFCVSQHQYHWWVAWYFNPYCNVRYTLSPNLRISVITTGLKQHCVHQEYRVWNVCCEAAGIKPEIVLTVKGVYTNPAAGTSEYGLTLRTVIHNASHTPTPLHNHTSLYDNPKKKRGDEISGREYQQLINHFFILTPY